MVRIIIKNPPAFMPLEMADFDGLYSLDLQPRSRIALTKQIDNYIEIGEIKQDTFKQIDLLGSNKNRLLLEGIGNPAALNKNNSKIFDIVLLKDDYNYPAQGLQVVENSDSNLSIVIFGELNTWIRPLSNLYLNQLELGSNVVDEAYIEDLQLNHAVHEDGESPVFPPLVNYGSWFINSNLFAYSAESQVVFNNYRLWHSVRALLKQAFCQVGHKLIMPLMDTEEFKRWWMYLLDPNFETIMQLDVLNRPFSVTDTGWIFTGLFNVTANGNTLGGVILFDTIISDVGNHYFNRPALPASTFPYHGGFYSGGIIGNFEFSGTVRINIPSGPLTTQAPEFITTKLIIKKGPRYGVNSQQQLFDQSTELASSTVVRKGQLLSGVNYDSDFNLVTQDVKVYQHEVVYVQIEFNAFLTNNGGQEFTETFLYQYTDLLADSTFKCNVKKQVLEKGDTIEFGKILRSDITALDLFKGVVHLPNGKIETNSISKEVSVYPESKIDFFDSGIQEGYFLDNINNPFQATNKIQTKSLKQPSTSTDLAREAYLKFLNSTDGYIAGLNLDNELHSKKVDFGNDFNDGVNPIENPLIEPLANGIDRKISGLGINFGVGDIRGSVNYIPFMWEAQVTNEGEYPKLGFNYKPRIGIAYDMPNNVYTTAAFNGQSDDSFSFFVYEDIPKSNYNPFAQIFPEGVSITPIPLNPSYDLNLSVVYGSGINENITNFYEMIYEMSIKQAYFAVPLGFLVLLDIVDFSNISFRRKWHLKYNSAMWGEIDIYCRLSSVKDYVIGENLTTSVELIPDNNNFIC